MSQPNPTVAAARVVIDELVRAGVDRFVVAPGSRSAALAMAAAQHHQVRLTVEIDERSAGFFALGVARESGGPAAVITTSGTAVANLFPAVIEADLDSVPLIVITADRPPELRHVGSNQTIDQIKIFGDRVRWFVEMGVPESRSDANAFWRSTVDQAVARAVGMVDRSPGPVHVNLPLREPSVPLTDDGRTRGTPFDYGTEGRPEGRAWTTVGSVDHRSIVDDPVEAERVVVAVARDVGPGFVGLAASHGWPVIAEPHSNARTEGSITTAHHLLQDSSVADELAADLVIEVGRVGLSPAVRAHLDRAPTRVMVDASWIDAGRRADHRVAVMPWPTVPRGVGGWLETWHGYERRARAALDRRLDEAGLTEPRVARDTVRALPDHGRLVVASSMPIRDLDRVMPPRDLTIRSNRGASGIDGFVSTALGVASATDEPVVALAGDLSTLHDCNGFLANPRPDAVFVVVNNDGGGIFSFLPQAGFADTFETVFGTPHGRSFARLADFHGITHTVVEEPGSFVPAVRDAIAAGGTQIVEVRTERDSNVVHSRSLTEAVLASL